MGAALGDLLGRARHDVDAGRLPSCQVAVARDGELLAFETFGAAADARYVVMSVTKAFVASAVWLLLGDGSLKVDDEIGSLVPEVDLPGVTIDHLLLHTAGLPAARVSAPAFRDRAARRADMARWRLDWEPGSQFVYHGTSAWWLLAEALYAVTGLDHSEFFRSRVAEPLGLSSTWVGAPEDIDVLPLVTADEVILELGSREAVVAGVPGAGGVSTAAEVARFYQALLSNPLWDAEVLADGTGCVRNTFIDPWTNVPANRTRGLVVAGDDGNAHMRQAHFGPGVSPRAFGHAGIGGQIAWADPDTGLSFSYLTNGFDTDIIRESKRCYGLSMRAAKV